MTSKQAQNWSAILLGIIGALLVAVGQWKNITPAPPVDPGVVVVPVDPALKLPVRVLVVWDHMKELPTSQDRIVNSLDFKHWIEQGGGSWRFVPDNADFSQADKRWQEIWASRLTELPCMVVSNGGPGGKGPLPTSLDEAKSLVEKFK